MTIISLAILLIGFSIFSSLVIVMTKFRADQYDDNPQSRLFGIVFVAALALLQAYHYNYLYLDLQIENSLIHSVLLILIAPSFYLFSSPILHAKQNSLLLKILHYAPVVLVFVLTSNQIRLLAFSLGGLYISWLAYGVYQLREQRQQFSWELILLASILLIAIMVVIMAFFSPVISQPMFISLHSIAIGVGFVLAVMVLMHKPMLTETVSALAKERYKVSSLNGIDCDKKLALLEKLMIEQHFYKSPDIKLSALADALSINSHQLSELLNVHLAKTFSRYIREQRINAAKKLLLAEPSASILSVGMMVGFSSQSNFYDAFREIAGMTPGQYRKISHA